MTFIRSGWSYVIAIWPYRRIMCNYCSVCEVPAMPWHLSPTGHRMHSGRRSPNCGSVNILTVCSSHRICRGRNHIRKYSMPHAIFSMSSRRNAPWLVINSRRTSRWVHYYIAKSKQNKITRSIRTTKRNPKNLSKKFDKPFSLSEWFHCLVKVKSRVYIIYVCTYLD